MTIRRWSTPALSSRGKNTAVMQISVVWWKEHISDANLRRWPLYHFSAQYYIRSANRLNRNLPQQDYGRLNYGVWLQIAPLTCEPSGLVGIFYPLQRGFSTMGIVHSKMRNRQGFEAGLHQDECPTATL
jgi:hypothetical protein